MKQQRVRIIGIGVTDEVDTAQMLEIVSNRETDYYPVTAFDQLIRILDEIIEQVRCAELQQLIK